VLRRRTGQRLRSSHRNFGAERKTGKRLKEASFLEAVLSLRRLEQGLETKSLAVLPGEVLHSCARRRLLADRVETCRLQG
jgi:hypothetical protein